MHDPPEVEKPCVACKRVTKFHLKKKSKKQPELRCDGCKSKRVVCTRMFGGWPIAAYNELSEAQKTEFWNAGVGKDNLFAALSVQVTNARVKESRNIKERRWLPKKSWVLLGYEEDNIETWPKQFDDETKDYTYTKTVQIDLTADITKDTKAELLSLKDNQGLRGKLSHYVSPSKGRKRGRSKDKAKGKKPKKARSASSNSNSSKSSGSSDSNSGSGSAPSTPPLTPKTKERQEREEKMRRIQDAKNQKKIDAAKARDVKKAAAIAEKKAKKDRMGYKSIMTYIYIYIKKYLHIHMCI